MVVNVFHLGSIATKTPVLKIVVVLNTPMVSKMSNELVVIPKKQKQKKKKQ